MKPLAAANCFILCGQTETCRSSKHAKSSRPKNLNAKALNVNLPFNLAFEEIWQGLQDIGAKVLAYRSLTHSLSLPSMRL
mmetsp:Transcript_14998/g.27640  ORF Transcript_14998/g.27640 Transcript_14998/m.27640 type:complete len:80 (+) Transcript_14998:261-500(+)